MRRKWIGLVLAVLLAIELIPFAVFARTDETAERINQDPAPAATTLELCTEENKDVVGKLNIKPLYEETKSDVAYQTYDFEYSSNEEFASEWALYDADGDGNNWLWEDLGSISGNCFIASESYSNSTGSALTPDNWAVSPGVAIPEAALNPYLTFYYAAADPNYPADHLEVYAALSRTMSGSTLLFSETLSTSSWQMATCDLSAFAGRTVYIAFRHCNCTDQFMPLVDCLRFYHSEPATLNSAANGVGNNLLFTSEGTYPWGVEYDGDEPYVKSGNAGVASSSSVLESSINAQAGDTLKFDFKAWGEGTSTIWDKCIFSVNGTNDHIWGANQNDNWETYSYTFPEDGTYTLTWTYSKDGSVNPSGDYFAINNVRLEKGTPDDLIAGYYFEDDGTGNPSWRSNWYTADNDGDGNKWIWAYNEGIAPYCYEGSGMFASLSVLNGTALTPDNFAIVGPITLKQSANILRFHAGGIGNDSQNREHFRVYYSTSLSSNWTSITNEVTTNGEFQTYNVNLDSLAGQTIYVAFRHYNCTNQNMLRLDAVEFYGSDEAMEPISTVDINGFVAPEWGATPNTSQTVPSGVHYTLNNTAWAYYDTVSGNQAQLPDGEIFNNPNYQYFQIFLILADTGYQFADNVTFRINGDASLVKQTNYNAENNYYLVYTYGYTVQEPAPQIIDTVEILGYVAPAWGEHPSYNITVPSGAHYTLDYFTWYAYDNGTNHTVSADDTFTNENYRYYLFCRFLPEDGWTWADNVTVIFDGDTQPFMQGGSGSGYFWFETPHVNVQEPAPQIIDTVEILGYVAPAWGEHPSYNITVPSGAHYTLDYFTWYAYDNGTNHTVSADDTFTNENYRYYLFCRFLPEDGWIWADNVTVIFDGDTQPFMQGGSGSGYFWFETPHVNVQDPATMIIDTVEIIGYVAPAWGEHPNYNITVPDGAHYSLASFMWEYYNGGTYNILDESEYFDNPDYEYNLYCRFRADEGWTFADNVTVIYNGDEQTAWQDSDYEYFYMETAYVTVQAPPAGLLGDIDGNGEVTTIDAVLALRHAMNIIALDDDQLARGDVDGNGIVNMTDGIYIMRYAMSIINAFPAE